VIYFTKFIFVGSWRCWFQN